MTTGDEKEVSLPYWCFECQVKVYLSRNDAVKCKECGQRILYKMRTTTEIQYLAR